MKILTLVVLSIVCALGVVSVLSAGEIMISFDDAPNGDSEYYTGLDRTQVLIEKLKEQNVPQVVFFCVSSIFFVFLIVLIE